ncbi:hypothetical protein ACROYT_G042133 [Oculina patagonica]
MMLRMHKHIPQADWFCPNGAEGLTQAGLRRINQSIEAFVYCVLGSQVNVRSSILGSGGRAKEAQSEFLVLVEDAIRQPDLAKSVQRYQLAIDEAKEGYHSKDKQPGVLSQKTDGLSSGFEKKAHNRALTELMPPFSQHLSGLFPTLCQWPSKSCLTFNYARILNMAVQANLRPTHNEKSLGALKAERAVKRKTFDRTEEERHNMLLDGIQIEVLNKIRSNAGYKKTSCVYTENKLSEIYGTKYRIRLDHQILTDHGAFYPQVLFNDLGFELKLAPASQVVRGSDPSKLKYKLTNIQLEYEMIRSNTLADEARSVYASGKEFAYDHIQRAIYGPFCGKFAYIMVICPTFAHNKTYHRIGENDPRRFVIICEQHDVENWLKLVSWFFEGTNTLKILDDCAASKDAKGRSGQLVNLGFSARHIGISVWVLTQKITSITPSFRENVAVIDLFYTPSA